MILDEIVADKKRRLIEIVQQIPLEKIRKEAEKEAHSNKNTPKRSFYDALKAPGLSIIGEFKKASPSLGTIQSKILLTERMDE